MSGSHLRPSTWHIRPREQRTILLIGDLIASILALLGGLYFWGSKDAWLHFSWDFLQIRVDLWFYLLPFFWMVLLVELYDLHRAKNARQTITWIAFAGLAGALAYSLIYLFSKQGSLPRLGIGFFLLFASLLTLAWRMIYIQIFTAQAYLRRILVIGAGKAGETLVRAYNSIKPQPFFLVGFMDDDPKKIEQRVEGFPVLAGNDRLLEIIQREGVSELVVAISGKMKGTTFQSLLDAQEGGTEELLGRVPIHHLEADWLLRSFVVEARVDSFYELAKRLMDILLGLVGLALCALLFPLVAVLILAESGTPVLYRQIRSGKGGKPYPVFKFRTMRQDAEKDGQVQLTREKDDRITRIGYLLRRTHIDEMPQFWNALRGEMSVVGPRSERPEWIAEFQKQIPFYRARLLVKPGITGWAQVNYSYYASVEEMAVKLEFDLYYIKHRNLLMDLSIILRTITQVVAFRGR
jgi:exopolysaccharide biosynthesis polyprenyl glycosylphosphotransferase